MSPPTINEVILAIGIPEGKLVDRLGIVVKLAHQWFSKQVLVRSFRAICHSNTDTARLLVVLDVVGPKEEVIFAPLFCDGGCPNCISSP